jgi:hypothetical protein
MLPKEVQEAKDAYNKAYDEIKDKLKANRIKYRGTNLEDCPPLIKEQGQFFVKRTDVEEARKEILLKYGQCENTWAYWIAWFRKKEKI